MVVNVHNTGVSGFNAMLSTPPSERVINYVNDSIRSVYDAGVNLGQRFLDNITTIYKNYGSNASINESKLLLAQTGAGFRDSSVYRVNYEDTGRANLRMQQYIMALPEVAERYDRNLCDGYRDTYVCAEVVNNKNCYGEEHTHYMDIMDGVYDMEKDVVKTYTHTGLSWDGSIITNADRFAVLDTYHNVMQKMIDGIDPTDYEEGVL